MLNVFSSLRRVFSVRLAVLLPDSARMAPPDGEVLRKRLVLLLTVWAATWSLLPLAVLDNAFIDVLENIVWGGHFQFGYDKNPYLGAWIGALAAGISGGGGGG